ncbi:MAG: hypothetical protein WA681_07235, partial [Candidatus Acidiferrales bacterium]
MAECLFTDRFKPHPLPVNLGRQELAARFHPVQTTISRFRYRVNGQGQHKEAAKNHSEQQFSGDQLLEEVRLKRNENDTTP